LRPELPHDDEDERTVHIDGRSGDAARDVMLQRFFRKAGSRIGRPAA
jgi:hypothetical protein